MTSQHTIGTCFCTFCLDDLFTRTPPYPAIPYSFEHSDTYAICNRFFFSTCLALDMDLRCGSHWVPQAQ